MTTTNMHEYTVGLNPTLAQRQQLWHLSWGTGLVRILAHDQIEAQARGIDVAIAGMLDQAQDHPDRAPGAEAWALQAVSELSGMPHGLLLEAIVAGRADHAGGHVPRRIDFPHVPIAGTGLLTPASAYGVTIAGVQGEIGADIAQLPRWAAQVWCQVAGVVLSQSALEVAGASLSTYTYIACTEKQGGERWEMDVLLEWSAYKPWELMRHASDDEERVTASPALAELMGWK